MRITLVIDANEPDQLARFWSEAMRYQVAEAFGQYRVLLPADGDPKGPALVLQGRAAGGADAAGKSRIHIDLHPKHPERHILTLQRMGARTVGARVEEFDLTSARLVCKPVTG
jgi:hypothetical protein